MKAGAFVWTNDLNGAIRAAQIVDGQLIGKALGAVPYYRVRRWKRSAGTWCKSVAIAAVIREFTDEERRTWGSEYEPPIVTPIGNLHDLFAAGGCSTDHEPKRTVG